MAKATLREYPAYQDLRVGCKVSWYTYTKQSDAKKAAKIAMHNAGILAERGYDFGYQMPGQITQTDAGWVVVIP